MTSVIRTQISLTNEQMEGLRRLAAQQGRSIASLLRDAVDQMLRAETVRDRALRAIGSHASGMADVGRRHDEYLSEIYGG